MRLRNRADYQINCSDSELVEQHHKDQCDVNKIVAKYNNSGVITHGNHRTPRYGDFSGPSDYLEACLIVKQAEESFMSMPSKIRARFDNDPAQFLDHVSNVENYDQLVELGLAEPRVEAVSEQSNIDQSDQNNSSAPD